MLILPRNIQALACCAGACLQSLCAWGNFNRRKWGIFNRRKLGNIQPALTASDGAIVNGRIVGHWHLDRDRTNSFALRSAVVLVDSPEWQYYGGRTS